VKPVAGAFLLALLAHGGALPARAAETAESLRKKANAVLAQLEGEIKVPGLKESVEVLRDRWGIPHIYAKNVDDVENGRAFVAAMIVR
jgi:penicillin amidase